MIDSEELHYIGMDKLQDEKKVQNNDIQVIAHVVSWLSLSISLSLPLSLSLSISLSLTHGIIEYPNKLSCLYM